MKFRVSGPLLFSIVASVFLVTSCSIFQQAEQMKALSKCNFRLKSVQNLTLAGVNIQQIRGFSDLGLIDAGKITASVATGKLPLIFTLNVEAQNPNDQLAAMNRLDWILLIDDIEMLRGALNERIEIAPNGGTYVIPLLMQMDLKQALSGKSAEAILNFGFNLAGVGGEPTRITLKAKPTIMVGNREIAYPGYISISNTFTSG